MTYPTNYVQARTPPSGGPTPGARALLGAGLIAAPGVTNLGIYNPRDVCGNVWPHFKCAASQHATGLAVDFGIPVSRRPSLGDRLAGLLVAASPSLGVTEVIWWRRRWTALGGWKPYSGRSSHEDHVHVTLHPEAGRNLTEAEARAALTTPPPPPEKVTPMFDPPHVLVPIAAEANAPEGGVVLLGTDGSTYAYGGAHAFPGANGQPWFVGRKAARLDYVGDPAQPTAPERWRITATSGERYHLPLRVAG